MYFTRTGLPAGLVHRTAEPGPTHTHERHIINTRLHGLCCFIAIIRSLKECRAVPSRFHRGLCTRQRGVRCSPSEKKARGERWHCGGTPLRLGVGVSSTSDHTSNRGSQCFNARSRNCALAMSKSGGTSVPAPCSHVGAGCRGTLSKGPRSGGSRLGLPADPRATRGLDGGFVSAEGGPPAAASWRCAPPLERMRAVATAVAASAAGVSCSGRRARGEFAVVSR